MNMPILTQSNANTNQVTMTSLEIVDFINEFRAKNESNPIQLRHDHFMAKVPKVLSEGGLPKFRDTHTNLQNGQTYPCFRFPKREACLMAMSYSYELQAQVFDRMTAMENHIAAQNQPSYMIDDPIKRAEKWIEEAKQKQAAIHQLEIAAPKVQYFDRVADVGNLMTASTVGKKLGMSAQVLNEHLKPLKVYDLRQAGKIFAQWFIDKGFGEVKKTSNGYNTSKFTNKGEQWIVEKLTSGGVI